MTTPWDNARRHARALETALDGKLASYAKIAATVSRGAGSHGNRDELSLEEEGVGGYKLVEEEVEELLGKVCHYFARGQPDFVLIMRASSWKKLKKQ